MGVVSFIVGVVSFIVGVVSFIVCVEVCSCHNEDQGASDDSSRLQLWEDGLHWSQKVYTHTPSILDTERSLTNSLSLSLFSEDLSRLAARKYARIIQKLGFPVSLHCSASVL